MYLSKLELVGFKSFAQKTEFKFTPGLTALVGPNGCGKTNIVDAIRWVLGEQKTSVLRSDLMENVIFNGTQTRKPLGMSEVAMTLQNNRNMLPTEYTEVTVTRRLFRSGESHYLLNNAQCRLRDVVDLFMDTGMGADSYSVIELKMVENILSGRPEERRHLIEEAAGVTKYKARRKEASRKLMQVQQDLLRVYDIVDEVGKQVRSLSRQAAKTKRYNALQQEFTELEIKVLKHKHYFLSQHIHKEESQISEFRTEKTDKERILAEKNENITRIDQEIESLNEKYNEARNNENEINQNLADKNKELAVAQEKISGLHDKEKNFNREVQESIESVESIKDKVQELNTELENKVMEQEEISTKTDMLKTLRDEKQAEVHEIREFVNEKNTELINVKNKINSYKAEINRNQSRYENQKRKKDEITNRIGAYEEEMADLERKINTEKNKQDDLANGLESAEKSLTDGQKHQDKLRKDIDALNVRISENRNKLSEKKTSLDFLSSLVDADESSKYLLKADDWKPASEKILLAEAIGADEEHRAAVDAALGEYGRVFVVDSRQEAAAAFHSLEKRQKGKATFLCRELIEAVPPPEKQINEDFAIGYLSEIVRTDDALRNAVRAVFKDTLLVDTLENAKKIVDEGICSVAVSLKGELVRKGGMIRGGAKLKKEGLSVGKKERIGKLKKEIEALEKTIAELQDKLNSAKKEISEINIHFLTKQVRDSERSFNENKSNIEKLKYKKESAENTISMQKQNIDRFGEELQEIESENEKIAEQKDALELSIVVLQEEYNDIQSRLDDAENALKNEEEAFRDAEKDKIKTITDIKNLRNEIANLEEQIKNLNLKAENRKREIEKNKEIIASLEQNIKEFQEAIEKLTFQSAEAQNTKEYIKQQLSSVKEQHKQYNEEFTRERLEYDKLVQRIYDREVKISESNVEYKHILETAREKYQFDLEENNFQPEENFNLQEANGQVNYLKDKLTAIGNVNFMALEEFDTQNERYEFYNKQVKDLTDSEKTLQETIDEINQTAQEKFLNTFDIVNANFKNLFLKLFGEGAESNLILSEGDPLEANVEIIAKPPGKRPHSIDTISSGEKTLTAIALLFAIYLVKPSPFCILDEVDAPLDDSNIDKFLALIKDFSDKTQFLIVTHNKKTMSAADTLYGITMQETGVSKIVSVRLASEINGK
jgi:chromosome segregation protein